jgi:hypothetical protein
MDLRELARAQQTVTGFIKSSDEGTITALVADPLVQISSSAAAFAALKSHGSVVTWGSTAHGGESSVVREFLTNDVHRIFSSRDGAAFAALKADRRVITWGDANHGGDSSSVNGSLSFGVRQVFTTSKAFAALKWDGSVVTWGLKQVGGDCSAINKHLANGVHHIYSTDSAFSAVKIDGFVVSWGFGLSTDYEGLVSRGYEVDVFFCAWNSESLFEQAGIRSRQSRWLSGNMG